jgi:hypothetical protein
MIPLDPFDTLDDVFNSHELNIPALLRRYKDYLKRMKDSGENPWTDQARRKSDFHLTEAVGHFHLYHWLSMALRKRCIIRPEFPTGNGKVDLHLLCNEDNKKGKYHQSRWEKRKKSQSWRFYPNPYTWRRWLWIKYITQCSSFF